MKKWNRTKSMKNGVHGRSGLCSCLPVFFCVLAIILAGSRTAYAGQVLALPDETETDKEIAPDEGETDRGFDLSSLTQALGSLDLGNLLGQSGSSGGSSGGSQAGADSVLGGILELLGVTHPLKECRISSVPDQTYTGRELRPTPVITYNGEKLKKGTDFTVKYKDNISVGTARITITGLGIYTGTRSVSFKIVRKGNASAKNSSSSRASKLTVKLTQTSYVYNGSARKPAVKVTCGGKTVTKTNYTVTYKDNKNVGKAVVTVKGKGDYKGLTGEAEFRITLKKTSLRTASSKETGTITAGWTADSQADGYQLQACTSKSFGSGVKKYTVQGSGSSSQVLNRLTSGKKYYVRIRSFKKVGSSNWYSEWSAAKQVSVR